MEKTADMNKYFTDYAQAAKLMTSWIYPTELRSIVDKGIDLQLESFMFINKQVANTANKFALTK